MTSEHIDGAELLKFQWSDYSLTGIEWLHDGRDLGLEFQVHVTEQVGRASAKALVVVCEWAHSIRLDVQTRNGQGGYPMTWEGKVRTLSTGGWSLGLDFGSRGVIELECSEIRATIQRLAD